MINSDKFSDNSPLISQELEGQLRDAFKNIKDDITLVSVIDADNEKCSEKCTELAIFLNHIAKLNDKISCIFYTQDEYLEKHLNDEDLKTNVPLSCDMLPLVGIFKGKDFCRIAFHGIPGGKEINSFVLAIINASGFMKPHSPELIDKLQKFTKKTEILICVSLQCHHCAKVVMECQLLALLNENIYVSIIDANLYPKIVSEYKVERVPMIIINKKHILMGNQTAEQVLDYLNGID